MTPTVEQLACVEAALTGSNLCITALAGAAKTSTLILIAEAMTSPILCLAFNKKIAQEMQARLPAWCDSRTLNALGYKVWWEKLGRARITIDSSKSYTILSELIAALRNPEEKAWAYQNLSEIIAMHDEGRTRGWVPDVFERANHRLVTDAGFFGGLDEEPQDFLCDLLTTASLRSIDLAFQGLIDFNDQIFMPTCFYATFPYYPVVMVDEAQDLSPLNHAMLRKIAVRSQLIAVGDPCQAIYGFRGAHEHSMALLTEQFSMATRELTISFRCPRAVIREARQRAPHMQWPDWAEEGTVTRLPTYTADVFEEWDVILCRNNSPLFTMAIKLLQAGKRPELANNDIGKSLLKVMKRLGPLDLTRLEALEALNRWLEDKLTRSRTPTQLHEQAACIRVFLNQAETLRGAIAYATHIFEQSGTIRLMTGHKAKGLEFPRVFFLDEHLCPAESRNQDRNIRYVIQTRAKQSLTYITSEGFLDE